MRNFVKILFLLCLCQLSSWGWADEPVNCAEDCVEVGSWSFSVGLGLGLRTNPLESKNDTPLVVLPEVSYYGKRFFLKNLEMGFTLWENPKHQFNLLLTPSYDQRHFNRWDINNFSDGSSSSNSLSAPAVSSIGGGGQGAPRQAEDIRFEVSSSSGSTGGAVGSSSSSSGYSVNPPVNSSSGVVDRGNGNAFDDAGGVLSDDVKNDASDKTPVESENTDEIKPPEPSAPAVPGDTGAVDDSPEFTEGDGQEAVDFDLKDRKMAALAGLEYMYSAGKVNLHFQGLSDVSNVHQGYELRFAATIPWQLAKDRWALTLGLNYQSQSVIEYYYGVRESEAPSYAWQYSPSSSGLTQMYRLDWQRSISQHWSLRAMLQYSTLPEGVSDSPIISEDYMATFFVGGVYHF